MYEVDLMKRLTLLLALLLLAGCARVTLPSGSMEGGAARYDDAAIKTAITSALLKKDAAKANDVNVHCFNGHVFLVGEADKEFRHTAAAEAERPEGVVHVTTHWFPTGTAASDDDAIIETEITGSLLFTEDVSTRRVGVDVWGGHVVLTGIASSQSEIDSAIGKVKKIKNVKSVTSYLSLN